MDKKFWGATFTLTGTIIGAGILGLPYVFSQSGFLYGLFWLIILSAIMLVISLALGEVVQNTKGNHQLAGYAKKYLGKTGQKIVILAMFIEIYAATLAYLIGEAQSLSQIFTGSLNYAILFGIGFWLIMTFLMHEGLKGLKKIETYGVLAVILIVISLFFYLFPQIQSQNLSIVSNQNFFFPIGVILFAFLGFTSIPELKMEIKGEIKNLKKAIIVGSLIPLILYILFTFTFVGTLGKNINPVATLSFGPIVTILGIFTMLTSYFVLSFSLKDMLQYDLNLSRPKVFFWTSIFPLFLFLIVSSLKFIDFATVLSVGGALAATLLGITVLIMNHKAKIKSKNRLKISKKIIIIISIILITGTILQIKNSLF